MPRYLLFLVLAALVCMPLHLHAQSRKPGLPSNGPGAKHKVPGPSLKWARPKPRVVEALPYNPLHLLGIRPGVSLDSILKLMLSAGAPMREVREDTLSHSFAVLPVRVFVVDSIICRLTYMRMVFIIDATGRLRRLTITPRESALALGATDDIENVLLLYFGQTWGKPELTLEPPLPNFRWRTGNIQVRGFIRRGYPVWVMEG